MKKPSPTTPPRNRFLDGLLNAGGAPYTAHQARVDALNNFLNSSPLAFNLLLMASFLKPDSIPVCLFVNEQNFNESLLFLKSKELIRYSFGAPTFQTDEALQKTAIETFPHPAKINLKELISKMTKRLKEGLKNPGKRDEKNLILEQVDTVLLHANAIKGFDRNLLAWLNYAAGQYCAVEKRESARAMTYLQAALSDLSHNKDKGKVWHMLAFACLLNHDHAQAEEYAGRALPVFSHGEEGLIHVYHILGHIEISKGHYDKAKRLYDMALKWVKALETSQENKKALMGSIQNSAGNAYIQLEQNDQNLEKAKNLLESALALNESITFEASVEKFLSLNYIGTLWVKLRLFDKAEAVYVLASKMIVELFGPDAVTRRANLQERFAALHFARGNVDRAKEYYLSAIVSYNLERNHFKEAGVYLSLMRISSFDLAMTYCLKAVELYDRLTDKASVINAMDEHRGLCDEEQNNINLSQVDIDGLESQATLSDYQEILDAREKLAAQFCKLGAFDKAQEQYLVIDQIYRVKLKLDDEMVVKNLKSLLVVQLYLKQFDAAFETVESALSLANIADADVCLRVELLDHKSMLLLQHKNLAAARVVFNEIEAACDEIKSPPVAAKILSVLLQFFNAIAVNYQHTLILIAVEPMLQKVGAQIKEDPLPSLSALFSAAHVLYNQKAYELAAKYCKIAATWLYSKEAFDAYFYKVNHFLLKILESENKDDSAVEIQYNLLLPQITLAAPPQPELLAQTLWSRTHYLLKKKRFEEASGVWDTVLEQYQQLPVFDNSECVDRNFRLFEQISNVRVLPGENGNQKVKMGERTLHLKFDDRHNVLYCYSEVCVLPEDPEKQKKLYLCLLTANAVRGAASGCVLSLSYYPSRVMLHTSLSMKATDGLFFSTEVDLFLETLDTWRTFCAAFAATEPGKSLPEMPICRPFYQCSGKYSRHALRLLGVMTKLTSDQPEQGIMMRPEYIASQMSLTQEKQNEFSLSLLGAFPDLEYLEDQPNHAILQTDQMCFPVCIEFRLAEQEVLFRGVLLDTLYTLEPDVQLGLVKAMLRANLLGEQTQRGKIGLERLSGEIVLHDAVPLSGNPVEFTQAVRRFCEVFAHCQSLIQPLLPDDDAHQVLHASPPMKRGPAFFAREDGSAAGGRRRVFTGRTMSG
jgi:tetratricopeptide (TPR) repeat protein